LIRHKKADNKYGHYQLLESAHVYIDATTILPLEFNVTDNITPSSNKELTDHDYIQSSVSLSNYVEDVVEYIALDLL
jgi:hypothetical protein